MHAAYLPLECTLEFLDRVHATIARISAHERRPTAEEEAELARCGLVLSVFETVRPSAGRGWPPSFLKGVLPRTAADLVDAVPTTMVADVAALAGAFAERYRTWNGRAATIGPQFAGSPDVGGADGDFIVDGCLWDIKTTVRTRGNGAWLHQLLGYLLLDYEDHHAIKRAGYLFPRRPAAVHRSVPRLIGSLSGRTDRTLADLRQRLRDRLGRKT